MFQVVISILLNMTQLQGLRKGQGLKAKARTKYSNFVLRGTQRPRQHSCMNIATTSTGPDALAAWEHVTVTCKMLADAIDEADT